MANIELDGANKKINVDSGDLTLDVPGDIILDADGADLVFADGGTNILKVTNSSSDVVFQPQVDAKDLKFNQYDGRTLLEVNDGGFVAIANGATGPGQLRLYEDTDNGTNYSAFQVGTQSGDITYTLPTADGSSGQVLSTNGSGTLSWATASSADPSSADGDSLGTASAEWSDLYLADGGIIYFGNDQDVTLTHDPDDGLFLKSIATGDDNPVLLTLQTGETDLAANDVIGKIAFQAPDEGTGTDAVLVSGAIQAVAEGDHSSSSNATSLEFMTGASEAATTKIKITSAGHLVPATDDTHDLGTSSLQFRNGYFDGTLEADAITVGGTTVSTATTIGALTDVTMDKASVGAGGGNFLYSILIDPTSDGSAPDLDAVDGNAYNNYGIGKDTFSALTSGSANVAIGEGAGKALTTGYSNVIIGGDAGDAMNTGYENVCVGVGSGSSIAGGERNVAIGRNALNDQSSAGGSVAIGWDALSGANNSYATAVGHQAGSSGYGSNSTYIGYQAYGSSNQNEIIISTGNPVGAGADTISIGKNGNRLYANFSSNNTWTQSSDERMKKNIADDTLGLSFINRLRTVTYNFKKASEYPEDFIYYDETNKNSKDDTITHHGLIAQEVKAAMDAESNTTFKGYDLANDGVHSISEGNFVYPLIKAVQELLAKNTALEARVKTLEDA
jgi:hypothetical protein